MEISVFMVISAGFLSFFSPCILPIIPAYLSYISGVNLQNKNISKYKIFYNTLFFVLGFTTSFISLQLLIKFSANFTLKYIKNDVVQVIAGLIIIFLGISMISFNKLNFFKSEKKIKLKITPGKFIISYIFGFIFGFGWTPCMGPVLVGIIAYTLPYSYTKGIYFMILYSISLSVPFIILSLFMDYFSIFLKKIEKYSKYIQFLSGLILIILGILLAFNKLSLLSNIQINN